MHRVHFLIAVSLSLPMLLLPLSSSSAHAATNHAPSKDDSSHLWIVEVPGIILPLPWNGMGQDVVSAQQHADQTFPELKKALANAHEKYKTIVAFSYNGRPSYRGVDTGQTIDKSARQLESQLESIVNQDPQATFSIVSHSLGGVVASYWISHYADDSNYVMLLRLQGIVTFDSPLQGETSDTLRGALESVLGGLTSLYLLKYYPVLNDLDPQSEVIKSLNSLDNTFWKNQVNLHSISNDADKFVLARDSYLGTQADIETNISTCSSDPSCHGSTAADGALSWFAACYWLSEGRQCSNPPAQPCAQQVGQKCVAIWSDRPAYQTGDRIGVCFSVPAAAYGKADDTHVRLTETLPDGSSRVWDTFDEYGTGECVHETANSVLGTRTITLDASGVVTDVESTSFDVTSGTVKCSTLTKGPLPAGCAVPTITTDRTQYAFGDPVTVCYTVPGPYHVTITLRHSDGTAVQVLDGQDDGTGGCLRPMPAGPPVGMHDMHLDVSVNGSLLASADAQYSVYNPCSVAVAATGGGTQPTSRCGSLTTDRSSYTVGQSVTVCYTMPFGLPAHVNIGITYPDGTSKTVLDSVDDGTGGCLPPGTAADPAGTRHLHMDVTLNRYNLGRFDTSYTVVDNSGGCGGTSAAATGAACCLSTCSGGARIWTDRTTYVVGSTITVCYSVPGPTRVRIIDTDANGVSQVVLDGNDDGTGGCLHGVVTPPTGTEHLHMDVYSLTTGQKITSADTSFQVVYATTARLHRHDASRGVRATHHLVWRSMPARLQSHTNHMPLAV